MKNFFKGISFSQISAGALAAITSFLLSAKIGLAGSVIGVAIGSIVSAVSTQIYQNVLKESSKKIQQATPFVSTDGDNAGGDDAHDDGAHGGGAVHTTSDGRVRADAAQTSRGTAQETAVMPDKTEMMSDGTAVMPDRTAVISRGHAAAQPAAASGTSHAATQTTGAPRVIASDGTIEPGVRPTVGIGSDGAPHVKTPRIDSKVAAAYGRRRNKRIAIAVSVVSALVAVLITAGVITLVTRGKGTDSVVRDWAATTSEHRRRPSRSPSVNPQPSDAPSRTADATPTGTPTSSQSPSDSESNAGDGDATRTTGGSGSSPSSLPTPSSSDTPSSSGSPTPSSSDSPSSSGSPTSDSTNGTNQGAANK